MKAISASVSVRNKDSEWYWYRYRYSGIGRTLPLAVPGVLVVLVEILIPRCIYITVIW